MSHTTSVFWRWYEKHERLHLTVAVSLFALQLVHLYWLATHVILFRLTGTDFFPTTQFWETALVLVDYTEIPALLTTSLYYLFHLRKKFQWRSVFFLVALNVQWLHLFWITDEFVVDQFTGTETGTVLPAWLAWIAILIDYLELPVIVDTVVKLIRSWRKHRLGVFLMKEFHSQPWKR